jgi:hypothetical protein
MVMGLFCVFYIKLLVVFHLTPSTWWMIFTNCCFINFFYVDYSVFLLFKIPCNIDICFTGKGNRFFNKVIISPDNSSQWSFICSSDPHRHWWWGFLQRLVWFWTN